MLTKSDEYIKDGYLKPNPDNEEEVIWAPEMRLRRVDVDAGMFEAAAMTGGEYDGTVPAPVVCANGVKKFCGQQAVAGFDKLIRKQADEQIAAIQKALTE